jgi:uncharacterized protein YjbJ (UPF0337 family)
VREYVRSDGDELRPIQREITMGYEDAKADVKKAAREVDNKAKETLRKADGEESLSDKAANLGDDIRNELGNAGDNVRRAADDVHTDAHDKPA